jgi:predicted O-methyltransferase YrrM
MSALSISRIFFMPVTAAFALAFAAATAAPQPEPPRPPAPEPADQVQVVIDRVERECRKETVYMIGPAKARRLAQLVRERKPQRVVECGTAIGYSGLWIARELQQLGSGKLITVEISDARAKRAEANFREAGLSDYVEVIVGDARQAAGEVEGPLDFAHIDCNASNYLPCFQAIRDKLSDGAVVVADNAGISAGGMQDYLQTVRTKYDSRTEWFELDLPWAKRDAMEITVIRAKAKPDDR